MKNIAVSRVTNLPDKEQLLVFTDMDGTLLNHHDYSFEAVEPLLQQLESRGIPVILCTSKTRAEVEPWRTRLHNKHPFIVENGAAIVLPECLEQTWPSLPEMPVKPLQVTRSAGFTELAFSRKREHWQDILQQVKKDYPGMFSSFAEMGTEGIMEATGLSRPEAEKANCRHYSEPVLWSGTDRAKQDFIHAVTALGAHILQGGRFLHLCDANNKGDALVWLCSLYKYTFGKTVFSIAAGDSPNDLAMLEAADIAICVRSPVSDTLQPQGHGQVIHTSNYGPAGWYEAINPIINPENKPQGGDS